MAVRPASAQYPGALEGRVTDALTGQPVENALIDVVTAGLSALSDGRGSFRIRGLEPGRHTARLTRLGYRPARHDVEVQNGASTWLDVRLAADPVPLAELRAGARTGAPTAGASSFAISRAEIERSGARTAAELLDGRAGLVVQRRGPTGPQRLSIRGGSADAVLVLLDGAPLADPLTGAADLSALPASQIESITVLKGSQSARFGPGAQAGVVLIESRTETTYPWSLRLASGSLGSWSGSAESGGRALGLQWSAGGGLRTSDGEFLFERPEAIGGGSDLRLNADLTEASAFAAARGTVAGGQLLLRAGWTRLGRGLPGPAYQSTPEARERLTRGRAQAAWERTAGRTRFAAGLHAFAQQVRFSDPEPPLGLPYDSRTDALGVGGRLGLEVDVDALVERLSAAFEFRDQRYESSELAEGTPNGRFDLGILAGGELAALPAPGSPRLAAALRLDRDGLDDLWRASHELTLSASAGPVGLQLRHASSYSPPTFGDQFFQEGVMVKPNPELRAERVPHDLSLGASIAGRLGTAVARLALEGYVADVKDMIIWAPDFRFVWSPRNFDVKRRGLDAEATFELPAQHLTLHAAYGLARATYDRLGGDDSVQVMYRPRHSGGVTLAWHPAAWEIAANASYTGVRYPVPASLNALAGYWTFDLRLRRTFEVDGWRFVPALAVNRLFDNDDSLIYGYPEPGRTLLFEVAMQPRGTR